MNPPPTSQPKESKPSRWKRGCLITGVVLVLLVPAYYWFESYTGRRALEKVVKEFADSGFPLEAEVVLPAAVPDAENFGATPLLDGIMDEEGAAATAKRKVLSDLLPTRILYPPKPASARKVAKLGAAPTPSPPLVTAEFDSLYATDPKWPNIRAFLLAHPTCKPAADEPSDVRAIYDALETQRTVFDELAAAAHRPLAQLIPAPRERIESWRQGDVFRPMGELVKLARFILLRSRAAAALGRNDEAAALSAVLWNLGRLPLAESTMLSHLVSKSIGPFWILSVHTIVRGGKADDAMLARLLSQCGSDWSPEKDLQRTFRGEASLVTASFRGLLAQASDSGNSLGSPSFQQRMIRYGPSGWVDHNISTGLRRIHRYYLSPLATGGFATLPASCDAMDSVTSSSMEQWAPDRFLGAPSGLFTPLSKGIVSHAQRIRLTLLAIAMERYRLKHGRYPADGTALVPDCIAAIPPDIDGAPLRVVTSPDGATSVIYSIGWNLTDDWHGVLPASYKEENDWQNADWPLSLPLPPLPPP